MQRSDFAYDLPPELIAQHPLAERRASRLLQLDGDSGAIHDRQFGNLPALLERGDLMVFNNTRVIPARLFGRKESGGRVECLVERIMSERRALARGVAEFQEDSDRCRVYNPLLYVCVYTVPPC